MGALAEKIVLITGGSKGIGRELASKIVAEGGTVVLVARHQESLAEAVDELGATNARSFCADVTEPGAAAEIVAFVRTECGRLDGLVNNAGSLCAFRRRVPRTSLRSWAGCIGMRFVYCAVEAYSLTTEKPPSPSPSSHPMTLRSTSATAGR